MTGEKYNEIFKLKKMLNDAKIPFFWRNCLDGYQVLYPSEELCICSVIEHQISYGHKEDLLEIRGLMTQKELKREDDDVLGYLTADDVFKRIRKHYNKEKKNGNATSER